jgi:hypothetical protein
VAIGDPDSAAISVSRALGEVLITVTGPVTPGIARRLVDELITALDSSPQRVTVDVTGCADLTAPILAALVRGGRVGRHLDIPVQVLGTAQAAEVVRRNGVERWVYVIVSDG